MAASRTKPTHITDVECVPEGTAREPTATADSGQHGPIRPTRGHAGSMEVPLHPYWKRFPFGSVSEPDPHHREIVVQIAMAQRLLAMAEPIGQQRGGGPRCLQKLPEIVGRHHRAVGPADFETSIGHDEQLGRSGDRARPGVVIPLMGGSIYQTTGFQFRLLTGVGCGDSRPSGDRVPARRPAVGRPWPPGSERPAARNRPDGPPHS